MNLGIGDDLSNKDDWNGPWKVRDGTHPLGLNFNILDNCKLDGYQISTKCTEKRGFGFGRIGIENNLNLLLIEFIKKYIKKINNEERFYENMSNNCRILLENLF